MTRPTVLINFAISADGKISTVNKDPAHFTSTRDLQRLLKIRGRADALMVGRGTLEADNMSMTSPPAVAVHRLARGEVRPRTQGIP